MKPTTPVSVDTATSTTPATLIKSSSLFDSTRPIEISVTDPESDSGLKSCTVRFPTDIEWCDRSRHLIAIRRNLGRDASRTEIPKVEQINRELFDRIRTDKGDDGTVSVQFDDADAMKVIERIERCQVSDVRKEGARYVIEMKVLSGKATKTVVHTLKVPSQRQIMDFGKSAVSVVNRRTTNETRIMLEPSGELWNKVNPEVSGYVGAVPIIHKDAALTELLMQVQSETEGDDPEV